MYNYPTGYGHNQNYGSYPPGVPGGRPNIPGMGPTSPDGPPGMVPPGVAPPIPGAALPGLMPNFPPSAANINFSAPVIRLGSAALSRPSGPDSAGPRGPALEQFGPKSAKSVLSHDQRDLGRSRDYLPAHPPTREEVARTIYIGNIPPTTSNSAVTSILRSVGGLRRWTRVLDAAGKDCDFGFAEFDDAESLETAVDVLVDVEVPRSAAGTDQKDERDKTKLLILVDKESKKYATEWKSKRAEPDDVVEARVEAAKSGLAKVLSSLCSPSHADEDSEMADANLAAIKSGDVVTIPLLGEDDLADIPPEVREIVIAEIAAFRERSNRRDIEILRRDELDRGSRRTRQSSPTLSSRGANGTPLGPRSRLDKPEKSNGKSRDKFSGIVYADPADVAALGAYLGSDYDSDAADSDLEKQRREKKNESLEKAFLDQERRWLNRERSRTAAIERENGREKEEDRLLDSRRKAMLDRLSQLDDDDPKTQASEDYFRDYTGWLRTRTSQRAREQAADDQDRAAERNEERATTTTVSAQGRDLANSFLSDQALEPAGQRKSAVEPQKIKLSLGAAAAQKAQPAPRRVGADVEGMLESDDETEVKVKRTLRPIEADDRDLAERTTEEQAEATKQLASSIPTDKAGLWSWEVEWKYMTADILDDHLIPFVSKKIVEFLGVQEQMLVDVVAGHIRKHSPPADLVAELDEILDEDAEVLVKDLWRRLIFFTESGKRKLSLA